VIKGQKGNVDQTGRVDKPAERSKTVVLSKRIQFVRNLEDIYYSPASPTS
jgi:hypothetical protein